MAPILKGKNLFLEVQKVDPCCKGRQKSRVASSESTHHLDSAIRGIMAVTNLLHLRL